MNAAPEILALNKYFEDRYRNRFMPATQRLSTQDRQGLDQFFTGLYLATDNDLLESPASSTSTLALEDEEVRSIFESAKANSDFQIPTHQMLHSRQSSLCEELNPNAAPFVPSLPLDVVSKLITNDTITPIARPIPRRLIPVPAPPPIQPVWLQCLEDGACKRSAPNHGRLALALVSSRHWTTEGQAELAQHFCWKGCGRQPDECEGIAQFALEVYKKFWDTVGPEFAHSFVWHLRECVVGTFKTFWDPVRTHLFFLLLRIECLHHGTGIDTSRPHVVPQPTLARTPRLRTLPCDLHRHTLSPEPHARPTRRNLH